MVSASRLVLHNVVLMHIRNRRFRAGEPLNSPADRTVSVSDLLATSSCEASYNLLHSFFITGCAYLVRQMFHFGEDVQPLSDFKRKSSEVLQQLKRTGRPVLLTLNGRAEVIVQDAGSYQKLLERLQELEDLSRRTQST